MIKDLLYKLGKELIRAVLLSFLICVVWNHTISIFFNTILISFPMCFSITILANILSYILNSILKF